MSPCLPDGAMDRVAAYNTRGGHSLQEPYPDQDRRPRSREVGTINRNIRLYLAQNPGKPLPDVRTHTFRCVRGKVQAYPNGGRVNLVAVEDNGPYTLDRLLADYERGRDAERILRRTVPGGIR